MRALWLGRAPYDPVLRVQHALRQQVLAGGEETLLLVEHAPVITLGHRATAGDLLVSTERLASQGIEMVRVQRGGQATYHGPGQLVVYPICRLRGGVVGHVDWITRAAVTVAAQLGILAEYRQQPVGVWVGDKKLGAVGVHVEHQVAIHGLALNVTSAATAPFRQGLFVACGARGAQVTSLVEQGAPSQLTPRQVADSFASELLLLRGLPKVAVESVDAASLFDVVSPALSR